MGSSSSTTSNSDPASKPEVDATSTTMHCDTPTEADDGTVCSKKDPLNVVLLIDITGSMSQQIEGVKQMSRTFAASLGATPLNLQLHVMTYTEASFPGACYTSHFTSADPFQLVQYIEKIKLSTPPEHPGVSASGGDGPENAVSGLVDMVERVGTDRDTICFLITDAPPHFRPETSTETMNERQWLVNKGYLDTADEYDAYLMLQTVIDAFQGRLVMCPVLYRAPIHWDATAAQMTGGLVLGSISNNSKQLAEGLLEIVEGLHRSRAAGRPVFQGRLQGFRVFDVRGIAEAQAEDDVRDQRVSLPSIGDINAAMYGLMESVLTISGRKFTKRTKVVALSHVVNCTRLIVFTAQQLAAMEVNEAEVKEVLDVVLSSMEAPEQHYLNKTLQRLGDIKAQLALRNTTAEVPQCIVSLETVAEALQHLPASTERQIQKWMEVVMRLLLVRLVNIKYPEKDGVPDFMDSWSANVQGIGPSMLTAHSAMLLRTDGTYKDPQSGQDHTAAVVFAHPTDHFASTILSLSSALPVLDLISTYLACGKAVSFPNIWAGTASASLLYLIRQCGNHDRPMNEGEWEQARSWLHSLRLHARPVGKSVLDSLAEGYLNPADAIAKVLGAFVWLMEDGKARRPIPITDQSVLLQYLAEELVTDDLRWHTKWIPDKFALSNFLSPEQLVRKMPQDIDPLAELHPLEGGTGTILRPDWQDQAAKALLSHPRREPLYRQLCMTATLLQADVHSETLPASQSNFEMGIPYDVVFLESAVLGRRTGRYDLKEGDKFVRKEVNLELAVVDWVRGQLATQLADLKKARRSAARAVLKEKMCAVRGSREECSTQLKEIQEVILGTEYRLDRMDATELLSLLPDEQLSTLGVALVIGPWTAMPPCSLRRHLRAIQTIFEKLECPELIEEITQHVGAAAVCNRTVGTNRHGHCATNPYPGNDNWSAEYAEERAKSGKPHVNEKLQRMKEYSDFARETRSRLDGMLVLEVMGPFLSTQTPDNLPALRTLANLLEDSEKVHFAAVSTEVRKEVMSILKKAGSFQKLRNALTQVSPILGTTLHWEKIHKKP